MFLFRLGGLSFSTAQLRNNFATETEAIQPKMGPGSFQLHAKTRLTVRNSCGRACAMTTYVKRTSAIQYNVRSHGNLCGESEAHLRKLDGLGLVPSSGTATITITITTPTMEVQRAHRKECGLTRENESASYQYSIFTVFPIFFPAVDGDLQESESRWTSSAFITERVD